VGSTDHLSQIVIANGKATVTAYHAKNAHYCWNMQGPYTANDATLKWVYSVHADGVTVNYNDLLEYHLMTHDGYYNNWMKERVGSGGGGYYKDGWDVWIEDGNWRGEDVGHVSQLVTNRSSAPIGTTIETLPPIVRTNGEWQDGKWVETFWNKDKTQFTAFVYSGQDKKYLIARVFGREEGGKWVETTISSVGFDKDFITRTVTYDKQGGTPISSVTVRRLGDGREVTFHGKAEGNHWVETATDTSAFKSRKETYDRLGGKLIARETTLVESGQVLVVKDSLQSNGTWVVETTGRQGFKYEKAVYGKLDDPKSMISREREYNDGRFSEEAWANGYEKWVWAKRDHADADKLEHWKLETQKWPVDTGGQRDQPVMVVERWFPSGILTYDKSVLAVDPNTLQFRGDLFYRDESRDGNWSEWQRFPNGADGQEAYRYRDKSNPKWEDAASYPRRYDGISAPESTWTAERK
jgi:hypothetical protein